MVFNNTFNNISFISLWSVLLVDETWAPRENNWPVAVTDKLSHHVVSNTPHHEQGSNSQLLWW